VRRRDQQKRKRGGLNFENKKRGEKGHRCHKEVAVDRWGGAGRRE